MRARVYSAFERRAIDDGLERLGGRVDAAPEGKRIESIEVVALDVIERRDPAPMAFNALHATSRRYVIEREVLLRPGEPWRQVLADETARNLRALPQLSLVVCLALQGSSPDLVRLAVITKDVWSLRLAWDVAYTPGGLDKLVLAPNEINVAGTHHTIGTRAEFSPVTLSLGGRVVSPRVLGSRVQAQAEAYAITNRHTGRVEGSFGYVSVARPLYSTQVAWGASTSLLWRNEITRRFVNGAVGTFDAKATPGDDRLPFEYRSRVVGVDAYVTRSYGWAIKHDVSFGVDGVFQRYWLPATLERAPVASREFERTKVPVSDHRLGPVAQMTTYATDFMTVLDLDTLGLQEDVRLGHTFTARVYPVLRALGSSRDYFGSALGGSYVFRLRDGFGVVGAGWLREANSLGEAADAAASGVVHIVTPRLPFGRLVFYTFGMYRYQNYQNRTSFLGGDTNLRGYPSNYFVGKDKLVYNFEWRTRPVAISSVMLAGTVFHDAGDAFDGPGDLRIKHSWGLGLRALVPQISRLVMRADVGFPLTRVADPGVSPVSFFVSFGQAFPPQPGAAP